jgi:hypothetical protein
MRRPRHPAALPRDPVAGPMAVLGTQGAAPSRGKAPANCRRTHLHVMCRWYLHAQLAHESAVDGQGPMHATPVWLILDKLVLYDLANPTSDHQQEHWLAVPVGHDVHVRPWHNRVLHAAGHAPGLHQAAALDAQVGGPRDAPLGGGALPSCGRPAGFQSTSASACGSPAHHPLLRDVHSSIILPVL